MTNVYLDEKYVGTVDNPTSFLKNIKEERRKQKLPLALNINYDPEFNEIGIHTSTGRVRRPLIVVENGQPLLTEDHLKKLESNELTW